MISLTSDCVNDLYARACALVLRDGRRAAPRGMATTEVMNVHLCLSDPRRRLVDLPPVRVLNPAFAVAEALWILSGSDEPWIFQYNRALRRYADDGRLQGAYGPRMRAWAGHVDQLAHVRHLLRTDPQSRQGVIQLFDAARDTCGYRDVPCTLGYRFYIRDGALQMHTTMRSNDVWLGLPYDVFTATLLQELLAGWLDVPMGAYHHHVDSLHLYHHHEQPAAQITSATVASVAMDPITVAWQDLDPVLATVIAGTPPDNVGAVWSMLARVMASYRSWTAGQRDTAQAIVAGTDGVLARALQRWYQHLPDRATTTALATTGER